MGTGTSSDPLTGRSFLSIAFRFVEPTWRNYIKYVDMEARDTAADNADARRYVEAWRSLPSRERQTHWPEQLCDLVNVPPCDLISWVTRQFWIEGSTQASMCLSFMRDKVLQKVGEFAMADAANLGHAKLFMGAAGLLPQGGGRASPPVNQFFNMGASASSVSAAGAKSSNVPEGTLRDMDSRIISLSEIMQTGSIDVAATRVPDELEEDEPDEDDEDE